MTLHELLKRVSTVHRKMANSHPKLRRGLVHCRKCGVVRRVDSADCLRRGWPECCGETMTIDTPEAWGEANMGDRRYYPYRLWLDEIVRRTRRNKKAARAAAAVPKMFQEAEP